MIAHTPYTMSIRQYAKFEKTKDIRLLLRIWVPMWYAIKHAQTFTESFNQLFNSNAESENEKLVLKILAQNKIILMQALLMAIQVHLGEKVQIELLKKSKLEIDKKLQYYISEVELCCDIKIEKLEDIITFQAELERKIDKYNELFPVKEVVKGTTILQFAFSVFSIMNLPFDGEMKLIELSELKTMANERAILQQQQIDKSNGS